MNWDITEDNWDKQYKWFLVDEGKIHYDFKSKNAALIYNKEGYLDYMLLTSLDNITHDTMLNPKKYRVWDNKIQTCLTIKSNYQT